MHVANNTVVALRYVMTDLGGNIMEDTMNGPAVEYLHGSGSILPQLEQELIGLGSGERTKFSFEDSGVGNISFDVIIDSVREAQQEELALGKPFSAQQSQDNCGPDCCC